jgi:hypothetical protein
MSPVVTSASLPDPVEAMSVPLWPLLVCLGTGTSPGELSIRISSLALRLLFLAFS